MFKKTRLYTKNYSNYFKFQSVIDLQRELSKTKNTGENKNLVQSIISGLVDLKNKTKEMSEDETEIEKPCEVIDIVKEILDFNNQNQKEEELKILTPEQVLSRLPITLAQLKAGNDSQKLKNEIRPLLYSLYRQKKLSKTIYKHFVSII